MILCGIECPRVYAKTGAFYYVDRARKWHRLGTNEHEAFRAYQERHAEVARGTVASLMQRYIAEVLPRKAPRTQQDNLTEARNLIGFFGAMQADAVEPIHVAQYLRLRGKTAPVRANREKALLSNLYTVAMTEWGVVNRNPCLGVHRNPESPKDRYVTHRELEAFCSVANPIVRLWARMIFRLGQRPGDVLMLELSQVTDDGIFVRQGKTGEPVLIEWTDGLRADYEALLALERVSVRKDKVLHPAPITPGAAIFRTRSGAHYTYDGMAAMFKRAMKKALEQGLLHESFSPHDLRAKAASDLDAVGGDAQQLLGHRRRSTTDVYLRKRRDRRVKGVDLLL
jgi:integrase